MTKGAETQANAEMGTMLMTMIQAMEQLDDSEKHRVLDAIYAFYDLRADPTFRLSDVGAMLTKLAEVASEMGPEILKNFSVGQSGAPMSEIPEVMMPPPPPPTSASDAGFGVGTAPMGVQVPAVDYAVSAIVGAMAQKLEPKYVAEMFANMLDYHHVFGGLPTQWVGYSAENAEEIVLFLAKQLPGMDASYAGEIAEALKECLAEEEAENNTTAAPEDPAGKD